VICNKEIKSVNPCCGDEVLQCEKLRLLSSKSEYLEIVDQMPLVEIRMRL
jgi:hypothetical protein